MSLGMLYTISAPSGAGKTSIVKALLQRVENICCSVSHTTRKQRAGEIEGKDYYFIDTPTFLNMIGNNAFLEHAQVFRQYYGTTAESVDKKLNAGEDVILEIDWQGVQQVKRLRPNCITIALVPPAVDTLERRLRERNLDSDDEIAHRMALAKAELSHAVECDYLVVNDCFDTALNELTSIIVSQRLKMDRQMLRHRTLLSALTK